MTKYNLEQLKAKVLSFGVNYQERINRIEKKKKHTQLDLLELSYNEGFTTALSLVMQDLEKIEQ